MTKRTLTAYGTRQAVWSLLNDDVHASDRNLTWFESALVTRMSSEHGATPRQTVNAILYFLDCGDLIVSPGKGPTGKFEPEYRIDPRCFG